MIIIIWKTKSGGINCNRVCLSTRKWKQYAFKLSSGVMSSPQQLTKSRLVQLLIIQCKVSQDTEASPWLNQQHGRRLENNFHFFYCYFGYNNSSNESKWETEKTDCSWPVSKKIAIVVYFGCAWKFLNEWCDEVLFWINKWNLIQFRPSDYYAMTQWLLFANFVQLFPSVSFMIEFF